MLIMFQVTQKKAKSESPTAFQPVSAKYQAGTLSTLNRPAYTAVGKAFHLVMIKKDGNFKLGSEKGNRKVCRVTSVGKESMMISLFIHYDVSLDHHHQSASDLIKIYSAFLS